MSKHKNLDYQLIVSGAHLDRNFGKTINEINSDGFKVSAEVNIEMDAKNLISNVRAIEMAY